MLNGRWLLACALLTGCAGAGAPPASAPSGEESQVPRVPPEVIQKIVRASYSTFRTCYEAGLGRDPNLTGKVVVRFVIERSGEVGAVSSDAGSTMPDQLVTACLLQAFRRLVFPEPNGGIVTVVYPIALSPD